MAGLTDTGFVPLTQTEIEDNIKGRLEIFSPGFDFTPESPDGQLIEIFSFQIAQLWEELSLIYYSYDPNQAVGDALRNLGLITGIEFLLASRSRADIDLIGTASTLVPRNSVVTDDDGNEFVTVIDAVIPSSVEVIALIEGILPVPAGTITTIKSNISGWTSIDQPADGILGTLAQTDNQYRNLRNNSVLKNYTSVPEALVSRLYELGVAQVSIINNNTDAVGPDGTPAQTIHVTVGELGIITDEQIGLVILDTMPLACTTYGTTSVVVQDFQNHDLTINFSKAIEVPIFVSMTIKFLDEEIAGAVEGIKNDVSEHINRLLAGEDVIWSRLFGLITPYGKAQVDILEIGKSLGTLGAVNVVLTDQEYASSNVIDIDITVV